MAALGLVETEERFRIPYDLLDGDEENLDDTVQDKVAEEVKRDAYIIVDALFKQMKLTDDRAMLTIIIALISIAKSSGKSEEQITKEVGEAWSAMFPGESRKKTKRVIKAIMAS